MQTEQDNLQYINNRLIDLYAKTPHLSRAQLQNVIGDTFIELLEADAFLWCVLPPMADAIPLFEHNAHQLDRTLLLSKANQWQRLPTRPQQSVVLKADEVKTSYVFFNVNKHSQTQALLFQCKPEAHIIRRFNLFFAHIKQMLALNMSLMQFAKSFYVITNQEGVLLESSHRLDNRMFKQTNTGDKVVCALKLHESGLSLVAEHKTQRIYGLSQPFLAKLTYQERVIVNQVRAGYANQAIATKLRISVSTVNNHLTRIYQKLNIAKRTQLLAL